MPCSRCEAYGHTSHSLAPRLPAAALANRGSVVHTVLGSRARLRCTKAANCSLWQMACTKPSSATAAVPDTCMRLRTSLRCPGSALALPAERLPAAGDASGACTTWEQTAST